jgi:prophage regulatory protein
MTRNVEGQQHDVGEDLRIARRPEVRAITGLSDPQLYAMMAKGEFPKPLALSKRARGWRVDELYAWIRNRPRAA